MRKHSSPATIAGNTAFVVGAIIVGYGVIHFSIWLRLQYCQLFDCIVLF